MQSYSDILKNINKYNPIAKVFKNNDYTNKEEKYENSVTDSAYNGVDDGSDIYSNSITFNQHIFNKGERIEKYRIMSLFPEVSDGLDYICDDAMNTNGDGDLLSLKYDEENIPKNVVDKAKKQFDYLMTQVFYTEEKGWELFRRWLVDAEIYLEVILDKSKKKISAVKILPVKKMNPIYKHGIIQGFVKNETTTTDGNITVLPFARNQVLYSNFGNFYKEGNSGVFGYLEPAIRPYNQLRSLEDSLVVYRLTRAPEKRVWNIDTGRMPKGKAEEYLKKLINKYRKRLSYDSSDGTIDSKSLKQAITEDYWFAKKEGGGSSVDTLQSGMNLGEIDDVNYFLRKLYKTLKLPKSRWDQDSNKNLPTSVGDITREELRFSNFIERLQNRFKYIFIDALLLQLKMDGVENKYLNTNLFDVKFNKINLYKLWKEQEINRQKLDMFSNISSYIMTRRNSEEAVLSREYAMKNYVGMTNDEYEENEKMRKKEMENLDKDYPKNDSGF